MKDLTLIEKVLKDSDFPKRLPFNKEDGSLFYTDEFNENNFYTENGKVFLDFIPEHGKPMRLGFKFGVYNCDKYFEKYNKPVRGNFENLIVWSEFK